MASVRVLAVYAAIAVAMTWPLAMRLGTAVPHDLGDPLGFTWIFWWNAQAVPFTGAWLNAPIFHPSHGAIVFQDSLLGVWPVTAGLQWLGASPLAVHNVLLIASFALSAFTAYLFCRRLFGDRVAAFAGGLVYGFAIFRIAQIPHLNILLTYWIPLIFLSLHEYLATRRWRWLLLAAACWGIQGLTSGYFIAYGGVLIGLWALFFLRGRVVDYARMALAFGLALAALWPWLSIYRHVHASYGFQRSLSEMDWFGADVAGLVRAPPYLTVWGRALGYEGGEDQFFPGLILAAFAVFVVLSSRYWARPRLSVASRVFIGLAAAFGLVALVSIVSPGSFDLAGVRVSLSRPYKPLSWVWVSLLVALVLSPPIRRVIRERSVPGFYALAALALWILSLGPTAKFLGYRLWYKAPYAWLLLVPGSDAVRVPARLWLLVVFALSVLVAYGLTKLRAEGRPRARLITAIVCAGLVIEAWPGGLPLPAPPERIDALEARAERSPVLELPIASPGWNTAAMYRSMFYRSPLVNGYSGYEPAPFGSLRVGVGTGDASVLSPFAESAPLDIVVHATAPDFAQLTSLVERAGAERLATTDRFTLYRLAQRPATADPPPSVRATISAIRQTDRGDVTRPLTDDNPRSSVDARTIDVTLARPCHVDEVQIGAPPGLGSVSVTGVGATTTELWAGSVAERSVRASLADPRDPRLRLRFTPTLAEQLRIQPRLAPGELAFVTQISVFGPDCGR